MYQSSIFLTYNDVEAILQCFVPRSKFPHVSCSKVQIIFKGYLEGSLKGRNVKNIQLHCYFLFRFLDVNTNIIRHLSHLSEMAGIFVPNTGTQEEAQSSLEGRMQGDVLVVCVCEHVYNSIVKCFLVNIFTDMSHNSIAIHRIKKKNIIIIWKTKKLWNPKEKTFTRLMEVWQQDYQKELYLCYISNS